MYTLELYARVRRAVLVEGKSQRWIAREFGLARKTVRKMLEYSVPPGYQRQKPVRRPKLGPWQGVIDAILDSDRSQPRKQRHTAGRPLWMPCLIVAEPASTGSVPRLSCREEEQHVARVEFVLDSL